MEVHRVSGPVEEASRLVERGHPALLRLETRLCLRRFPASLHMTGVIQTGVQYAPHPLDNNCAATILCFREAVRSRSNRLRGQSFTAGFGKHLSWKDWLRWSQQWQVPFPSALGIAGPSSSASNFISSKRSSAILQPNT